MGVRAKETKLKIGATEIAAITDIDGLNLSRETIDVTAHDSPDNWRMFIKGLKDAGEVRLTINYIPDNITHDATTGLLEDFSDDSTNTTFTIVFPTSPVTEWSFPGAVTDFRPRTPVDGVVTASVTIRCMGKPTLA